MKFSVAQVENRTGVGDPGYTKLRKQKLQEPASAPLGLVNLANDYPQTATGTLVESGRGRDVTPLQRPAP